ncbi:hypothetical protein V1511DRAFT_506288 [Dipodascopsis uninucleata]
MPQIGDQHKTSNPLAQNPFAQRQQMIENPWTAQKIDELQSKLDRNLGPEFISSRPAAGGRDVFYIEGWKAINLANEVFGFNGWSSEIKNVQVDYLEEHRENGRVNLGLSVTIRVTLKDGTFHEDFGYGHIENAKAKYMAFDKCKKEATTDGLKRALRNFGNCMGLCLYDRTYLRDISKVSAPTKKRLNTSDLHRAPEIAASIEREREKELTKDREQERGRTLTSQSDSGATTRNMQESANIRQRSMSAADQRGKDQANMISSVESMESRQLQGQVERSSNQPPGPRPAPANRSTPNQLRLPSSSNHQVAEVIKSAGAMETSDESYFGSDLIDDFCDPFEEFAASGDFDDLDMEEIDGGIAFTPPNRENMRNHHPGNLRASNNITNYENAIPTSTAGTSERLIGQIQEDQSTSRPVQFFSARVAEAVQSNGALDEKATFNVHFSSPSMRKTVDHSTSRPITRQSVNNRMNYENPRLNPNRLIGLPPSSQKSPLSRNNSPVGHNVQQNGIGKRPHPDDTNSRSSQQYQLSECTNQILNVTGESQVAGDQKKQRL